MRLADSYPDLSFDLLRQLDEESWVVSAEDVDNVHLMSVIDGTEHHQFMRFRLAGDEIRCQVELLENTTQVLQQGCTAPRTNFCNLFDAALGLAVMQRELAHLRARGN